MNGHYPTAWLNCRYPYDSRSRNAEIEQITLDRIGRSPIILDLGAGNGANYKHFRDKLPAAKWVCMEIDPVLMDEIARLDTGIELTNRSLLDAPELLDTYDISLVMANAVLDLFPEEQLITLINAFLEKGIPFLATLNYTGMEFFPGHRMDRWVVDKYNRHMQRPQHFGVAMGPDAPQMLRSYYSDKVRSGNSTWNLESKDRSIQQYLLGFMNDSIPELELSAAEHSGFLDWINLRVDQLKNGQLSMKVMHEDMLIG